MKRVRYAGLFSALLVLALAACGNTTPTASPINPTFPASSPTMAPISSPAPSEPTPEASSGRARSPQSMVEVFLQTFQTQPTSEDLLAYLSTTRRGEITAAQLPTLLQINGPLTSFTVEEGVTDPATNNAVVPVTLVVNGTTERRLVNLVPEGMGGEIVWHIDSITPAP